MYAWWVSVSLVKMRPHTCTIWLAIDWSRKSWVSAVFNNRALFLLGYISFTSLPVHLASEFRLKVQYVCSEWVGWRVCGYTKWQGYIIRCNSLCKKEQKERERERERAKRDGEQVIYPVICEAWRVAEASLGKIQWHRFHGGLIGGGKKNRLRSEFSLSRRVQGQESRSSGLTTSLTHSHCVSKDRGFSR